MLNKFIEISMRERLGVIGGIIILAALGFYSLREIPIDSQPDVTNNQVQIITAVSGLSPVETERLVTFPIETAMNGLPDMTELRSISKYGLSVVTVVFEDNVDPYFARQIVMERLQSVKGDLPPAASEPTIGPLSSALGEIYQYEVKGAHYSAMELRGIQDYVVKQQLKTIPGVTEVNSFGGFVKQYQVAVSPLKLQTYGLTLSDVFEALEKGNSISSGNFIEHNDEQYIIRGLGMASGTEDLKNIAVGTNNNVPIFIKDVAEVSVGSEIRQGAVTRDGKGEAVTGIVMMLRGENSREVIQRVQEKVDDLNRILKPQGIEIESFYDQTTLVLRTIQTVQTNLIEGGLLVVFVLVAFLGNLRAALIVAAVIPFSMFFTFIGMNWLGLSANLMSLGAIDFGMVVDGSVVMMENIIRRLEHDKKGDRIHVIRESAYEVSRPIFFGVMIILMVYVPILTLQGMEGKLFSPMAFAVGFAIFGSLILALGVVPVFATFVFKGDVKEKENKLLTWLQPHYETVLRAALRHRFLTLAIAVVLLALTFATVPFMGREFLPELDEGNSLIEAKMLPSVSLDKSIEKGEKISRILKKFPEVKTVVAKTGRPDIANDYMGVHETDIFVILNPIETWTTAETKSALEDTLRKAIEPVTSGMYINFSQPIAMRVNELVSGTKADVAVKIFGDDYDDLERYAHAIEEIALGVQGTASVLVEQVSGQPYLNLHIDRNETARYGLSIADVQTAIETAVGGKVATEILEGRQRYGVLVRFEKNAREQILSLKNILIPLPDRNSRLPLGQLARFEQTEGPAQVSHESSQRRLVVECNIDGRDIGSYVEELRTKIESTVKMKPGYLIDYGGQFENQERAMTRLAIVVPLAIFIIFVLLYLMFGQIRYAALILVNLPFATIGGVFALLLRDLPLSVTASIGFIALFGVAVLNGVVLISYINDLRETHPDWDLNTAIISACKTRLRPVLMTALVASLGFIPMATSHGVGAEVQRPLATVVIGGLITSTLLTLLVLPTVYETMEERVLRRKRG
ncbi:heavy metal efflux pump, CzcA family [Chloroherpeton thalassium ATCC 35110]|uniref:Heavy metal efflux pump, CzcA family n=1 Tax=Chloroherpeton thalassium (strain ATCC 35110 / GB-78) TaxID=517418 RepID=B3QUH9_CHLT3|nr:CusA/CzcA family heavy metal efflux RND transporter [Chloroherpeton thalassium]ACF12885.1 heavy metal efflux pump, CzcA family [Chloroherpeton thalassium ATCC 35110]